jgi:hypothetical protein
MIPGCYYCDYFLCGLKYIFNIWGWLHIKHLYDRNETNLEKIESH